MGRWGYLAARWGHWRASLLILALAVILAISIQAQAPMYKTTTTTEVRPPTILVFKTPAGKYPLTGTPLVNSRVMVFVNGLLMCDGGVDYNVVDNYVVLKKPVTDLTPVVQVIFW